MGSTRPMWVGLGRAGLNFFLPTMVGWVKKSPQPDPCTPLPFGELNDIFSNGPKKYCFMRIFISAYKLKCFSKK